MIRCQFTLRSLLILIVIIAIPLGWFPWKRREIASREAEVDLVRNTMQVRVLYAYELDGSSPPGPAWLRRLLGDNAFAEPEIECSFTNGKLSCLRQCPRLKRLRLLGYTVDDMKELAVLAELPHLTHLNLSGTFIGDDELGCIAGLNRLEELDLRNTLVTDAGLRHLVALKSLRVLRLEEASGAEPNRLYVTDEGMRWVSKLTGLEELTVSSYPLSDRGVRELRDLPRLRSLELNCTEITDLTLEELREFPHLETVDVSNTGVTPAAIDRYKQSSPHISVISGSGIFF